MTQFPDHSAFAIHRLSVDTYHRLRRSLLDQARNPDSILLTETDLGDQGLVWDDWSDLVLFITPTTQGILVQREAPLPRSALLGTGDECSVGLMTDPKPMMAVVDSLLAQQIDPDLHQQLSQGQAQLRDRPSASCPELLLSLLPTLTAPTSPPPVPSPSLSPSTVCQPVQAALDQQLEQSLLLNQVITKIRQSLDLRSILSTTVEEVRQFLEADRLLVYQFFRTPPPPAQPDDAQAPSRRDRLDRGQVTYEALASPHISSVMNFTEGHCFETTTPSHQTYLTGHPVAVNDIQERYQDAPCLLNFLQKAQVRAKVVAPILVQHELWGLLVAHDCQGPREWQPRELIFLQHIAEHLAIAVQQAELYEQLQQQAHSLEACVIDRTQRLRDALAAAKAANLAKSEFLATMSHELRTPLTCIIGMSATLLRWSFGELSPRQRHYLTTIHESGERLLALINDILEMAKIESGRTVLEIDSFSLTSLAQQAIEPFREQARDRDIELAFESTLLADQDTFTGDSHRIQQILDNLLSNALKFTNAGGQVNLRVRRENHTAVFQVEDTGIGIPESQIPLLFEKFQQLETSRQRQYQGTGLGLALTKQLAELHGGTVMVHSRVGVGSVFTVRIPLQRAEQRSPSLDMPEEEIPTTPIVGRIVLVEDHEETAGIICDLLTAAEYQVIWVIEGSQVVEQVALLQPSVVIINMQLSSIDGQRISQDLKDSLLTPHVKILGLRSRHDPPSAFHNTDATIPLPLDPEILLEKVNALVSLAETSSS